MAENDQGRMYSGGKVGVDVLPDFSRFHEQFTADLARYRNERISVGVDLDPDASKYYREARSIDGRTLRNTVRIDGDASGLRRLAEERDRMARDFRDRPIVSRYELDDSTLGRTLNDIRDRQRRTVEAMQRENLRANDDAARMFSRTASVFRQQSEDASRFTRAQLYDLTGILNSDMNPAVTQLQERIAGIGDRVAANNRIILDARDQRNRLENEELAKLTDIYDRLTETRARVNELTEAYGAAAVKVEDLKTRLKEAVKEKDTLAAVKLRGDLDKARTELRDYRRELTAATREATKLQKAYDNAGTGRYAATMKRLSERISETEESTARLNEQQEKLRREIASTRYAEFSKEIADGLTRFTRDTGLFTKALDLQASAAAKQEEYVKASTRALDEHERTVVMLDTAMRKTLDKAKYTVDAYDDALDHANDTVSGFVRDVKQGNETILRQAGVVDSTARKMEEYRQVGADLNRMFDEQEREILKTVKAFRQFQPMGANLEIGQQINAFLDGLRRARKDAAENPIKVDVQLDRIEWDKTYEKVLGDALELSRKLNEKHEIDVRVKYWEDNAEKIEDRLNRLRHERVDIPADFTVSQERIAKRMREIAAQIKADPDRAWELEANLDLDMRKAEERIKEFQKDHDQFRMDVDLETALASAHLAYLTRPRTIDIFTNFKGTDLGKIMQGMTTGATGLQGVENQFQNLVNLFDRLDKSVPKWSMIGAGLSSIGAGAINAARSLTGVATGLAAISQAGLALSGAVIGLGAMRVVIQNIWGDKGKTFQEQIDIATTKVGQLDQMMVTAFYKDARPAIRDLVNDISGTLIPGMTGMADAMGGVVKQVANVVRESDQAGKLAVIFENDRKAIENLSPGLENAAKAVLDLGDQTSKYLPRAASYVSDVTAKWAAWVEQASKSGAITQAMEEAVRQGGFLWSSVKSLTGVITGLAKPLEDGQDGLRVFSETLAKADRAVNSVKFQTTMDSWVQGAKLAQEGLRDSFKDVADAAYSLKDVTGTVFKDAGQIVGDAISGISRLLQGAGPGIETFSNGVRDGFSKVFDALGDSSAMFDSLLSMVGRMSSAFGGTFAATLEATAPLIQLIADAAGKAAEAFNSLPDPIKAAMGLWVTFGKAGVDALNSVKTGMLNNIQKTLEYKAMLENVGVSAGNARIGIIDLAKATYAINTGKTITPLTTALRETSKEAQNGAAQWGGLSVAVGDVGGKAKGAREGLGNVSEAAERAAQIADRSMGAKTGMAGALSKVGSAAKNAGGMILDAMGGPVWAGVAAGVGAVTVAYSDYARKAQATETASDSFRSSLERIATQVSDTKDKVSEFGQALRDAFNNSDFGETGLNWLSDLTTGFDSAADASGKTKVSVDDMSNAVEGGKASYEALRASLQRTIDAGRSTVAVQGGMAVSYDETARAAQKQQEALDKAYASTVQQLKEQAKSNGVSEDTVDKLNDMGEGFDQIAAKIQSVTEKERNHAQAADILRNSLSEQQTAIISANTAGSRYEDTFSQIGGTVGRVNELVESGQRVWDAQAGSFDLTTQAGRDASDALGTLASNANDYIEAMVNSGRSVEDVNAKNASMRQSFEDVATQMTGNRDVAKQLADQYMATPQQISTMFEAKTEGARLNLLQYVSLIRDTFPDGKGQAMYDAIVKAITSDAVTDITGVQNLVDQYSSNDYVAVMSADNQQVLMSVDEAISKGAEFKDGKWVATLNAVDLASGVIDTVNGKPLGGKTAMLGADAKPATDTMAWLDSLNLAPHTTQLLADMSDANNGINLVNAQVLDPHTTTLLADTWDALQGIGTVNASQLDSHTTQLLADTLNAFGGIDAVNRAWLDPKTTALLADITNAMNGIGTVNGAGLAQKIVDVLANTDSFWYAVRDINGSRVGTVYFNAEIAELKTTSGRVARGYATGGRVNGPGTGVSDSIPTNLSNGEMVIRAASVRKLDRTQGRGFLDSLNRYGDVMMAREQASKPSPTALRYRARSLALASGGRVMATGRDGWTVNVNPVIKVEMPERQTMDTTGAGMTINQTFNYPTITPIPVQTNQKLDRAAMLGAL